MNGGLAKADRPLGGRASPDRPPLALRVLAGLTGVAALAISTALLISDRAPRVVRSLLGGFARRLSDRIDANGRATVAGRAGASQTDFFVHVAIWALVIVLVGLAIWTWRGLLISAVAVFVCSVVVECAQGWFSDTRTVEWSDIVANGVGVVCGAAVVAACYLLWRSAASRLTSST